MEEQGKYSVSISEQGRVEFVHLGKDDTLSDGKEIIDLHENLVFRVLISAIHVKLFYPLYGELFLLQLDLVRVRRKFRGKIPHAIRECSRK